VDSVPREQKVFHPCASVRVFLELIFRCYRSNALDQGSRCFRVFRGYSLFMVPVNGQAVASVVETTFVYGKHTLIYLCNVGVMA
jgi:hypothetical protein